MFLGAYHFTGHPEPLLAGYRKLMAHYPPESLDLHVCVIHATGMIVYDSCPSRELFDEFSQGESFRAALAAAGLPEPSVEYLGKVYAAQIRQPVSTHVGTGR